MYVDHANEMILNWVYYHYKTIFAFDSFLINTWLYDSIFPQAILKGKTFLGLESNIIKIVCKEMFLLINSVNTKIFLIAFIRKTLQY